MVVPGTAGTDHIRHLQVITCRCTGKLYCDKLNLCSVARTADQMAPSGETQHPSFGRVI